MDDDFIAVIAILMPVLMVGTIFVLKHRQQRREWQYRERMKALEMGLPAPGTGAWPAAVAAVGIGAGVPIGCFTVAWLASLTAGAEEVVFVGATIVSLVAVVKGTCLATRLASMSSGGAEGTYPAVHRTNGKPPVYDPDAFDVVSRRG